MNNVYSFIGFSNTGKTTYLEKLIAILTQSGYDVALIKHTSHSEAFFLGKSGQMKDTDRHFLAGAKHVLLSGPSGFSMVSRQNEPDIEDMVLQVSQDDFVFTEGYKQGPFRKIIVNKDWNLVDCQNNKQDAYAVVGCASDNALGIFSIDMPEELANHLIALKESS